MSSQPISPGHVLCGLHVGTVVVHNSAGECRVRLSGEARDRLDELAPGHYLLCVEGVSLEASGEEAIASLTVKGAGDSKLYSERLVPELSVGEHRLVATHFQELTPAPSASRTPRP